MSFWTRELPGRTLRAEVIAGALYLSDSAGADYDPEPHLDAADHDPAAAAQLFFRAEADDAAGFDVAAGAAAEDKTTFWEYLRAQADPERAVRIETYGNKFRQFKHYAGVERRFNALVICSQKPKHLDLRHVRGTHPDIQKSVQAGKRFEEVMTNVVVTTERDDLHCVGIFCRAGHHRSVACAELLKRHVYPRAVIKHLTLNR